ncbi:MAG TPA: hypothetical protein VF669_18020 [Tepidisphaeraceae bacterium]|jgi:hypothetical protein
MWPRRLTRISLVVAALLAVALGVLLYLSRVTTPVTNFVNAVATPLETPDVGKVMDYPNAGDGTAVYRQAIGWVIAERSKYERFAETGALADFDLKKFPAVGLVLEGRRFAQAKIFTSAPEEVLSYAQEKPAVEAAAILGRICADRVGLLLLKRKGLAEAREHFEAALALGDRLARERLTFEELEVGLGMMGSALQGLALVEEAAGNEPRAAMLREMNQTRLALLKDRVMPRVRVLRSVDANVVGQHAGDVLAISEGCAEKVWRDEAILGLGRMRFFIGTGRRADQRAAEGMLRKLAKDGDAVVRAGAKAGLALTVDGYRGQ